MKDHKDGHSNINTQIIGINYAQIRNTETFDSNRADSLVWVSVLKIIKNQFPKLPKLNWMRTGTKAAVN